MHSPDNTLPPPPPEPDDISPRPATPEQVELCYCTNCDGRPPPPPRPLNPPPPLPDDVIPWPSWCPPPPPPRPPRPPPNPDGSITIRYPCLAKPKQVDLCYRAACAGDLDGVKEQVWQLFHNPAYKGKEPFPGWLFPSLLEAIEQENLEIVQVLLNENVADGNDVIEPAVRARAFRVLEMLLRNGFDINQPVGPNEPPVMRYYF